MIARTELVRACNRHKLLTRAVFREWTMRRPRAAILSRICSQVIFRSLLSRHTQTQRDTQNVTKGRIRAQVKADGLRTLQRRVIREWMLVCLHELVVRTRSAVHSKLHHAKATSPRQPDDTHKSLSSGRNWHASRRMHRHYGSGGEHIKDVIQDMFPHHTSREKLITMARVMDAWLVALRESDLYKRERQTEDSRRKMHSLQASDDILSVNWKTVESTKCNVGEDEGSGREVDPQVDLLELKSSFGLRLLPRLQAQRDELIHRERGLLERAKEKDGTTERKELE
jgi:hypothetical protein